MTKTKKSNELVFCRNCRKASAFLGNGNYCAARGRRVCSGNRYGKFCDDYERKN